MFRFALTSLACYVQVLILNISSQNFKNQNQIFFQGDTLPGEGKECTLICNSMLDEVCSNVAQPAISIPAMEDIAGDDDCEEMEEIMTHL